MNTISGLIDDVDELFSRYGFIVICGDSAAFGICEIIVS